MIETAPVSKLSDIVDSALAAHEAFRRLGFDADDIYFDVIGPLVNGPVETLGCIQVLVRLSTQGRNFSILCGFLEDEKQDIVRALLDAFTGWNETWTDARRTEVWEHAMIANDSVTLVTGLLDRGFKLPLRSNTNHAEA